MPLRNRNGIWYVRFKIDRKSYSFTTGLAATKQNENAARTQEAQAREGILEGRRPSRKILVRQFGDAAEQFLQWAEMEYRAHPHSWRPFEG